jgi:hypothetical protein
MKMEVWQRMRVTRPTLSIFLSELDQLEKDAFMVREAAKAWNKQQEYRDNYGIVDQQYISSLRYRLEKAIIRYRQQLAKIYDFTGDSGLR